MHEIRYFRFPYKKSKKMILKECQIVANENGDYPNQITGIDFKNFDFFKNEIEVNKWLEKMIEAIIMLLCLLKEQMASNYGL